MSLTKNEDLDKIRIGRQIRDLRKSQGITQAEIAKRTGKSIGYISQVERGTSSLPIPILQKISQILGVQITWFFHADGEGSPEESNHIVRANSRRKLNLSGVGIEEEMLSPWMNGQFLMVQTTFLPNAETDRQQRARKGEEGGYIESGRLELVVNDHSFILGKGDSFSVAPEDNFYARNLSDAESTVVIWVMSPGTY